MQRVLQEGIRIIGLGYGTFAILLGIILAILLFILARFTRYTELITLIGLIIPAILLLVFLLPPRESQRSDTESSDVNDPRFIPYIIFMILSAIGFILAIIFNFQAYVFNYKFGKNVAQLGLNSGVEVEKRKLTEAHSEVEDEQRRLLP